MLGDSKNPTRFFCIEIKFVVNVLFFISILTRSLKRNFIESSSKELFIRAIHSRYSQGGIQKEVFIRDIPKEVFIS